MYGLKKPCANCPFLRGTPTKLTPGRIEEIAGNMLRFNGGEFLCHKTAESDEEGNTVATSQSQHCAGALIFALKNDNWTQMMRIMARIGAFDPDALMADQKTVDSVFDTEDEMLEHNYWGTFL